jgi:hypothetical protein
VKSTNGTRNRQHVNSIRASGMRCDEQTLADSEQTAAARLAGAPERDATAHPRDLAGAARDRAAALPAPNWRHGHVAQSRRERTEARAGGVCCVGLP